MIKRALETRKHKSFLRFRIFSPLYSRYVFWTNWVKIGEGSHSKIERANLDGTDRRTVVHSGVVWVSGLAIDYQLDRVYWSDRFHRHISSSTIHGKVLDTPSTHPTNLACFTSEYFQKLSQYLGTFLAKPRIPLGGFGVRHFSLLGPGPGDF